MVSKDWDYLEPDQKPTLGLVAQLAQERLHVERGIKVATERLAEIDSELREEFPPDIGEFQTDFDGYLVTCKRGSRWTWDNESLKKTYGPLPPKWVKTTYSISRTAYEKLDDEEKQSINSALSVTRGGAKVSVQKLGGTSVQTEKSK